MIHPIERTETEPAKTEPYITHHIKVEEALDPQVLINLAKLREEVSDA